MTSLLSKVIFEYDFVNDPAYISNKDKRNIPLILGVEAIFRIKVNDDLYFEEELAILELYKALFRWKEKIEENKVTEFHYYSVEYADYHDGSIISLLPFSDKARLKSIWGISKHDQVFDLTYIVKEFLVLEQKMKRDIESRFKIELKQFIKHIPYSTRSIL